MKHRETRVELCRNNLDKDDDWLDVAFSDEKRFSMEPRVNRKNDVIWDDMPDDDKHFEPRSKYGGKSCEVWGCITYWGKPNLIFIERPIVTASDGNRYKMKFKAADYRDNILKKAIPKLAAIFQENEVDDWRFQQDGDSKHTSKLVQEWLKQNCPNFIDKESWPANSPDLNIIENVWALMDAELAKRNIRTYRGLKAAIRKIWSEKVTVEYIRSLYDSVPRRFQAVIDADGYPTKY